MELCLRSAALCLPLSFTTDLWSADGPVGAVSFLRWPPCSWTTLFDWRGKQKQKHNNKTKLSFVSELAQKHYGSASRENTAVWSFLPLPGKLFLDVWKTQPGSSLSESTVQSCEYRSQIGISWVLTIPSCLGTSRLCCQTSAVVEGKDVSSVLFGRLPPWHRSAQDILHGSRGTL